MSDSDREILAFAAAHRLVLAGQIQILLGVSERDARERLAVLGAAGLLRRERVLHSQPGCYQITKPGLAAIESDLPPAQLDLRSYRKDIGVAWVWLAARDGAFSKVERVITKPELRSLERARTAAERADEGTEPRTPLTGPDEPAFAVRLDSSGAGVAPRLH